MRRSEAEIVVSNLRLQRDEASDSVASKTPDLYPQMAYDGSLIKAGTRINWKGQLKRANVDLWATTQNDPDNAPILWSDLLYFKGYRIIPESITAALAFAANEIGYWPLTKKFYRAVNNNTVWTPVAYALAWVEVEV